MPAVALSLKLTVVDSSFFTDVVVIMFTRYVCVDAATIETNALNHFVACRTVTGPHSESGIGPVQPVSGSVGECVVLHQSYPVITGISVPSARA